MSKIYVIVDLHGRCDLLCEARATIEHYAGDSGGTFVCLSDFVDRRPEPRSCVE